MEEITIIALGLIVGSFLNVVIYRLPEDKSIVLPGSHCPICRRPVLPYDNIPVLSYLFLGRRCRFCKSEISFRYPAVELFTGFTFWVGYHYFGEEPVHSAFATLYLCLIIVLALIDYDHQILPDQLTLGGGVIFLMYAFFNPHLNVLDAYAGAFGSALVFAALYIYYIKVRKIEGLGQGDIKLMLLLGAFLGVQKVVVAVLVASLAGMLVGFYMILVQGKNMRMKLPYGTFLGAGSYVALFWGDRIMMAINSLYR